MMDDIIYSIPNYEELLTNDKIIKLQKYKSSNLKRDIIENVNYKLSCDEWLGFNNVIPCRIEDGLELEQFIIESQ